MLSIFSLFREKVFNYALSVSSGNSAEDAGLVYGEQPALSDPDFFLKVKNDFILQKANFIEANLSSMKLSVYREGLLEKEVSILTKGKEGSWWETPAGIYKIMSKEKNHFSSFGKVYQPWSMAFQGNFFIHGWPYYPDGTEVASTYSGGCIRLSTEDAQAIFELSNMGMPVLVYKQDFTADDFQYQVRTPDITASKYLTADIQNNFVFLEKERSEPFSPGAFAQMLGGLVATDYINIEKKIVLTSDLLQDVTSERYEEGKSITPFDLLHPMLLESDGNALRIFSNYLSPKRFTTLSNEKAKAVGMVRSSFSVNTSTEEGVTTAEDLFYLSKYLYHNRKFILDLSAGRQTNTIYERSLWADIPNQNIFFEDKNFVGGKAIKNQDGTESFLGVFEIYAKKEKRPVFIFLENSQNVKDEVSAIIQYLQNSYR